MTLKKKMFNWKFSVIAQKYQIQRGAMFSLALPLMLLPGRLLHVRFKEIPNLAGSETVIFLMGMASWIAIRSISEYFHFRLIWTRVLFEILACAVISVIFYELSPFDDFPNASLKNLPLLKKTGIMLNRGFLIGFILIPLTFFFENLENEKRTKIEMEKMQQKDLKLKLDSLRQQLDPHFLFNSLNVLKSGTNEEWVKSFVMQLSNFYRYSLSHGQGSGLVSIDIEMQFIHAYINILKERFENGITITDTLSPEAKLRNIPVLALQTLVENAVKHNVISSKYPLQIHIYDEGNYLTVTNTRHLKRNGYKHVTEGFSIGLRNLEERYNLISNTSIIITEEENHFTVKLPMI